MVVVPKNTSLNVRISGSVDPEISIDPNTTSATVDLSVAIPQLVVVPCEWNYLCNRFSK